MNINIEILKASIYQHEKAIDELNFSLGNTHPRVLKINSELNKMKDKLYICINLK